MSVAGSFNAEVCVNDKCVATEFYVVEEKGQTLLGYKTAIDLGILQFQRQTNVLNVNDGKLDKLKLEKFPKSFNGIGKLKNFQLKIPIDEAVQPIIQPLRRVPYYLRSKLEAKLDELESLDIIEKVDGPSKWVSPIVVVPKKNSDIRICVEECKHSCDP